MAQEFNELQRHYEHSKCCDLCIQQNLVCSHPQPTPLEKLLELKRKRTSRPFIIVFILFFLLQFSGTMAMRPYIVQIFTAYEVPMATDEIVALLSFIDNVGNVGFVFLVRSTGRRNLYLAMGFGIFLSSLVIALYGFIYLPSGYNSFDHHEHHPPHLENRNLAYVPMICLFAWSFFSFCGFLQMPWVMLSELFSFKYEFFKNKFFFICSSYFCFNF